ncbi:hypothetical protein CCP3SC15_1130009 [Gammaproteobacteria bacterium]
MPQSLDLEKEIRGWGQRHPQLPHLQGYLLPKVLSCEVVPSVFADSEAVSPLSGVSVPSYSVSAEASAEVNVPPIVPAELDIVPVVPLVIESPYISNTNLFLSIWAQLGVWRHERQRWAFWSVAALVVGFLLFQGFFHPSSSVRDAVQLLYSGRISDAIDTYRQNNRVISTDSLDQDLDRKVATELDTLSRIFPKGPIPDHYLDCGNTIPPNLCLIRYLAARRISSDINANSFSELLNRMGQYLDSSLAQQIVDAYGLSVPFKKFLGGILERGDPRLINMSLADHTMDWAGMAPEVKSRLTSFIFF